jgi:hypothetical protein
MPAPHDMGPNDDMSYLDIELELILKSVGLHHIFWMISILEIT